MRRAHRGFWLLLALLVGVGPALTTKARAADAATTQAHQAVSLSVRTGDHAGFGRVVIDLAPGVRHTLAARESGATLKFTTAHGQVVLTSRARVPRNVKALVAHDAVLDLTFAPGARLRSYRLGERLVLDIADAKPDAAQRPAVATAPARQPPVMSVSSTSTPSTTQSPPPHAAAPAAAAPARSPPAEKPATRAAVPEPPAAPQAAPREPVTAAPLDGSATPAQPLAASIAGPGDRAVATGVTQAVTLPFGPAVGAAALRRGDVALVVFDDRRPLDLAPLRGDPVLRDASITILPTATVMRLPLPANSRLGLSRVKQGWVVSVLPADASEPNFQPIRPEMDEGRLRLAAAAPGQVVSVPDPLTGGSLLVGTLRGEGQGVPVDRRTPEFTLLPTWQGVAVIARTDALTLRPTAQGFVLAADAERALALSAPESQTRAMTEAAGASRRYDLPGVKLEALQRRLQSATLAASAAAPQARTARRRDVAEALLALGMGAEMQAVMKVTVAEDARAGEDPDIVGLASIAALLAGRTREAAGIDDPRLTGSDEVALWRAVRAAQAEPGAPRPAAIFASAMNLLLSYPAPLRDRLLPLALETMAQGGEAIAAAAVLKKLGDASGLDLARAQVAERTGADAAAVLALYDKVANGTDRRARAIAARRAVELRLAGGVLTPAQAADALEKLVFAWRGDGLEVDTRLRIAELRAQAGAWRRALADLRETRQIFPDEAARIRQRLMDTFARSLAPEAQAALSPLDLVALAEENVDLLPEGGAGHELAASLAERLVALDLPQRAAAVLEKLVAEAPPGVARAVLGGRLAALRLEESSPQAALDALAGSVVEGAMPPALLESRTLTYARAASKVGNLTTAVGTLAELATPAAQELRATLLEEAKDWPGATAALAARAAAVLPAAGALDAVQSRLVLRLASAASQAGDERMLARLRTEYLPRLGEPALRDLLDVITAAPVRGVADLPRAAQEARLARGMATSLQALAPRDPP